MTAQHGASVILAIGNGGGPETFTAIGGMRLTRMALGLRAQDAGNVESGAWRSLLTGAGPRALTLSGSGAFTNSASEHTLRGHALAGTAANYKLTFPDGDYVTGAFLVTTYERSGTMGREEEFSVTLDSAGAIAYTSA